MDQELIAYLDARFRENSAQFEGLSQQIQGLQRDVTENTRRIEGLERGVAENGEQIRYTQVQVEGLRGDIQLLAEGIMGSNERNDKLQVAVDRGFREVRTLMASAYSSFHQRVNALETWREIKERDPLELIRERFGRNRGPASD
ncbi:MAG: hypothetical protein ACJ75H_10865 [Thermoanaerobaculia bacterium]